MTTVRLAKPADADAIGRVQVETWRAAYSGLLPDETIAGFDVASRQQLWREGLARRPRPGSATFVAELDGEVVGFVSVGRSRDDETGNEGELYAIYLHPSCWDRGIGRALIERAEESLRTSGFERALLWVLQGNERGERFYRAAGWTADGSKEDEFGGATVVEIRYRKAL
ncbi:MAG TPA: GNAT family N-acetyltransferase [Gaiellaceae bacterium]|jgi:GNAT superfamily N-acetyltransferase